MKTIGAAVAFAILLVASQARATSKVFNILFDETPGFVFQRADWQGTYVLTDGFVASFSATVGDCSVLGVQYCTFFQLPNPLSLPLGDPDISGGFVAAFGGSRLSYTGAGANLEGFSHLWTTVNSQDLVFQRVGVYRVQSTVAEPSALWLIFAGLALIAGSKFRKL